MVSWKKRLALGLSGLVDRSAQLTRVGVAVALLGANSNAWAAANPNFTVGVNNMPGSPTSVAPGSSTTVRITLTNDSATPLTGVNFSNLVPNPAVGNTLVSLDGTYQISGSAGCAGTLSVTAGSGTLSLSGMTVPAKTASAAVCYIDVPVKAVSNTGSASTVSYSLLGGAVADAGGDTNFTGGSQNFTISAVSPPTWAKSFASGTAVLGGSNVNLTLTVSNPSTGVDLTGVDFEDVFPTAGAGGAIIEPVSVVSVSPGSCGNTGNVALTTGAAAKVAVSGLSVAKNTTCSVVVSVRALQTNGSYELLNRNNQLLTSSFSSDQGLKPAANAQDPITVRSPLSVAKSANPVRVTSGGTGTFVITLSNSGSTPLPVNPFNESSIDNGGVGGVRLTPTAIANSCGGTNTFTNSAGGGIQTSGYSIPAGGSCQITVSFTGTTANNNPLTFTNNIPQGAVQITGQPGIVSQQQSATVTLIDELYVDKSGPSPSRVAPGNPAQFSVTVSNFGGSARNNVHVADNLVGATFLTGMFGGADRTPTSNCGATTANAVGDTALDFVIPALPAAAGNTPGQCTITFWALTDPNGSGAMNNQIASCGVWYGASQSDAQTNHTCNGSASNNTGSISQAPLLADKTFNGTNYQYTGGYNAGNNTNYGGVATQTGNTRPEGSVVTMRIRLRNYNDQAITGVSVSDTFPAGLKVANPANYSTNCGGVITAAAGSSSLALNGGVLAARTAGSNTPGMCTVQVDVVGPAGSYPNTANVNASLAQPTGSKNLAATSNTATLVYTGALSATKVFSPTTMTAAGKSQVRIRLTNSDSSATLTNVSVTDPLTSAQLNWPTPPTSTPPAVAARY